MDDVDKRNGLSDEELAEGGIEYFVCGKFQAGEKDTKMFDSSLWVPLQELEALGGEAFDTAMGVFDAREPRLRQEARSGAD